MSNTDPEKITLTGEPLTMRKRRCYDCGRWWAYEWFEAGEPECPVCAGKLVARLRETIAKIERAVAALKGVVSRKGKRK